MPSCPSDDTFTDFIEGRLSGDKLNAFYQHASICQACAATLAELSRSTAPAHSLSRRPSELEGPPASSDRGLLQEWVVRPEAVGRYRPSEVLGTGGMGIVYLARDTQLNRNVALKVTRVGVSHASARRLLLEAQAMAKLSHRNVVTVYDVGMWREHVFVAMEYLEGGTLARHLLEHPQPWQEILEKFLQAGAGLAAAHRALIVHRDFKPENVLLTAGGEVRVADFGLARLLSEAGLDTTGGLHAKSDTVNPVRVGLTRMGTLLGTPAYMAPEQIKGLAVDHRADIWSFCASLYEALYCELPFPGRTPREILKHVELGSIRHAPLGMKVPPWLRQVLLRGLKAKPSARYQAMDELLVALMTPRRSGSTRVRPAAIAAAAAICVAAGGVYVKVVGNRVDFSVSASTQPHVETLPTSPAIQTLAVAATSLREPAANPATPSIDIVPLSPTAVASSAAHASAERVTSIGHLPSSGNRAARGEARGETRGEARPEAPKSSAEPTVHSRASPEGLRNETDEPPPQVVTRHGVPIIRD